MLGTLLWHAGKFTAAGAFLPRLCEARTTSLLLLVRWTGRGEMRAVIDMAVETGAQQMTVDEIGKGPSRTAFICICEVGRRLVSSSSSSRSI